MRSTSTARCPRGAAKAVSLLAIGLTILAGGVLATVVQPAVAARLQPDDPFADELNPFGTGRAKPSAPAATPPQEPRPANKPAAKLPVPFPETTLPGEPADRRERTLGREGRSVPRDRNRDRDGDRELGGQSTAEADQLRRERLFGFGDAAEEAEQREPSEAEKKLAEADQFERQGKFDEARQLLLEVVKLEPSLMVGHLALGVVLRRLGDFRGSVDACSKGIEIDPLEPELFLRRGISWFHLGLYGIALEDFEEAAGMSYDDPRPELWRGLTLMELDRPLEAINAYASAIRRDRTFMLAYLNRGLAYLATNEPRKAEFDFNQAIRQTPKDARAWANRGVAQARQGRYREAVESYETALKITPKNKALLQNRDAARSMAGQESANRSR
jgi:tetratricopeptide (TPR) repeat protein